MNLDLEAQMLGNPARGQNNAEIMAASVILTEEDQESTEEFQAALESFLAENT